MCLFTLKIKHLQSKESLDWLIDWIPVEHTSAESHYVLLETFKKLWLFISMLYIKI